MNVREEYIPALMGLSLRNVQATVYDGKKELYSDFGEMLFTHFGVSGPLIISASAYVGKILQKKHELKLVSRHFPKSSWMREFCGNLMQTIINSLKMQLPDCFRQNYFRS